MTREEFMDVVYSELRSDGDNYRANRIIDAADEYAEEQTKWISVGDKLPEEEEKSYWVCLDGGGQCQCRWTNNMYGLGANEWSKWGWHVMDKPQYSHVVAWMSLPESYHPKDGE